MKTMMWFYSLFSMISIPALMTTIENRFGLFYDFLKTKIDSYHIHGTFICIAY
jgi:hypothetical protein